MAGCLKFFPPTIGKYPQHHPPKHLPTWRRPRGFLAAPKNAEFPSRVGPRGSVVTWASLAPKTMSEGLVIVKATTTHQEDTSIGTVGSEVTFGGHWAGVDWPELLVDGAGHRRGQDAAHQAGTRSTRDGLSLSSSFPTPTSQPPHPNPRRFFFRRPGRGVPATSSRPGGPCKGQPAWLRSAGPPTPSPHCWPSPPMPDGNRPNWAKDEDLLL